MVVIEASPVGTRRVSAAVAAAGLSSFALLYAPQPVLPQLAAAFRLDPGTASLAIGVATGALAVAVLPLAWLAGRVGRRRVILWSVLGSAMIGLLLPLAPSFPALLAMRAVQGVAIAGFAGVAAAYLADQLGTARLAAAVGAMIAGNSVGGMTGRLGVGFATGPLGWQGALTVVAGVSLVCALFAALTLPRTHHSPAPLPPEPDPTSDGQAQAIETGRPNRGPQAIGASRPAQAPPNQGPQTIGASRPAQAPPNQGPQTIGAGRPAQAPPNQGPQTIGASRPAQAPPNRRPQAIGADRPAEAAAAGVVEAGRLAATATLERTPESGRRRRLGAGLLTPLAVGTLGMGSFVALYNAAGFRLSAPPLSLTPAAASLIFLAYAMGTASSAAAGRLTSRWGRTPALVTALIVTVAGSALTLHGSLAVIAAGLAVLTAGFFAAHTIANAWVAADAPPHARGRAAGLYTLCYYLGSGAGGTAGSIVYGHAGWAWLIATTSVWLLLATLAVLATARRGGRLTRGSVRASRSAT
ncbi:MFS transporter [Nonomuraea sp. NPDC046802]|uniref:MFS transporter n=1 Tax=Nonomuraea sp. NPDC046802 TaxID=3154919 RepID=UPI0033EE23C7